MKTLPYSKENISFARLLRKNMTKEERHLWYDFLRTYPVKFYHSFARRLLPLR